MIPSSAPCFTAPSIPSPSPQRAWQTPDLHRHPTRLNARKNPPERLLLERVEASEPEQPPLRPLHELVGMLHVHALRCASQAGITRLQWNLPAAELLTALEQAQEVGNQWVRLCQQLTIGSPDAVNKVNKVLNFVKDRLEDALSRTDAVPGFSHALPDLQAAIAGVTSLLQQAGGMPDYIASVRPADGRWDREPPTVAQVLLMMQAPAQDPSTVRARLEDGQRPIDIACAPTPATASDMDALRRQLAQRIGNPDLALPLNEVQILLDTPRMPLEVIEQGLRCGLNATDTRALFQAGVPIHPQTAPDPVLRAHLASLKPVTTQQVGKGMVNQVHLHGWTDGVKTWSYTWRPEHPDAEADAMTDVGIPTRRATDWHRPGPNLTGRQVLTHRLGALLGLERHLQVTASYTAVIDGVYGSLNEYVPGLQKLLIQSPHDLSLPPDDLQWLCTWADAPQLLADIARWQGLTRLTLTGSGLRAEVSEAQLGGSSVHLPLIRPLDVSRAEVRRQMVVAVWFHLLTGQVDWNAGNVAFAADPDRPDRQRLVLFDNDLAFGRCLMHPEDACNNQRHQPTGPRVRPARSVLHGTRMPTVIPADLARAMLKLTPQEMLACGAAGLIRLPEWRALESRLHHLQEQVRALQPHGWLHTEMDWLSAETTTALGLDDLPAQAQAIAHDLLHPPNGRADTTRLRDIESDSLMRALAVGQTVARRHPEQRWFPGVLDEAAIRSAVRQERERQSRSMDGSASQGIMHS